MAGVHAADVILESALVFATPLHAENTVFAQLVAMAFSKRDPVCVQS